VYQNVLAIFCLVVVVVVVGDQILYSILVQSHPAMVDIKCILICY